MATPYRFHISPKSTGLLHFDQTEEAAAKATEFLQKDLERHHVFFNNSGFHNHIAHHILSLYSTGAGPSWLTKAYDRNASYQRPAQATHAAIAASDLHDWPKAQKYLGREKHYPDFLSFYQREIDQLGWQAALNKHMFAGDARADDTLQRMFAGFLHPLIQLLYGVEWEQPALVAEALAQAAAHKNTLGEFLAAAEKRSLDTKGAMPRLMDLYKDVAADEALAGAAHFADENKVYDGVLGRAPDEAVALCGRVHVDAEELEERTAEMFAAAAYVAVAAAIHPPKQPKVDFFLMHHVNAAPIFLTLNKQTWLTTANKLRILEWKIRMDLVQYAARGCPKLSFDDVVAYRPHDSSLVTSPAELLPRFHATADDGHTIKLARAILLCKQVCEKFKDKPSVLFKDDGAWLKTTYLLLDSVEGQEEGSLWIRSAGFDEAWKDVPEMRPPAHDVGA